MFRSWQQALGVAKCHGHLAVGESKGECVLCKINDDVHQFSEQAAWYEFLASRLRDLVCLFAWRWGSTDRCFIEVVIATMKKLW
jgi:hypothetical protein